MRIKLVARRDDRNKMDPSGIYIDDLSVQNCEEYSKLLVLVKYW